jgi:capsular exopolysaccharide synthesis family protein
LENLKLKYGLKHPKLIQAAQLVEKTQEALTNAYASSVVGLEGSWRAAKTNLEQNKEKLRIFTEQSIKNKKIRQEFEGITEQLTRLRSELIATQTAIAKTELLIGNIFSPVKVLSSSDNQSKKEAPNYIFYTIIGLSIGLITAAVLVTMISFLDTVLIDAGDLPRITGIPVLAHICKHADLTKHNLADTAWYLSSKLKRDFDRLSSNISLDLHSKNCRSFLVTSATPSEGKSFVAVNLALSYAHMNEKVVLIDADCRLPSVAVKLHLTNSRGLIGFLNGSFELDQVIQHQAIGSLDIITSGGKSKEASRLLNSSRFEELLKILLAKYDRIIIDSPPTLSVGDSFLMMPYVEGVIFVAGKRVVKKNTLLSAVNKIQHFKVNILGFVINYSSDEFFSVKTEPKVDDEKKA